jgi:hypothetical protein
MSFIKGYKFTTEANAIYAQSECDMHYGIPVSENSVTRHWIEYNYASLNEPKFWYIIHHNSLEDVLGEPETFDIVEPILTSIK